MRGQRGGASIPCLEVTHGTRQLRLQTLYHYIVMTQDRQQVVIVAFKKLQQYMLDIDFVVTFREAQRSGAFGRIAAGVIELGKE